MPEIAGSRARARARMLRSGVVAALLLALPRLAAASPAFQVANPDWSINVTARGYSDFLVEQEQLYLREYLSGEWGAALAWDGAPMGGGVWLEPEWIFPDWTTNSSFLTITQDFTSFDGGQTWTSTFDNGVFSVTQTLEMIDTAGLPGGPGIAQGSSPASALGAGSAWFSNRYVLRHRYAVTNVSGAPVSGVRFFQLLHGLHSTHGVYDDRSYGGAFPDYHYDITQWGRIAAVVDLDVPFDDPGRFLSTDGFSFFFDAGGTDEDVRMLLGQSAQDIDAWFLSELGFSSPGLADTFSRADAYQVNDDVIAFHAMTEPDRFELGEFGNPGNSDHEVGKPPTGVHLSVESGQLDGVSDEKTPEGLWVAGGMQFDWGTLAVDETREIDFLLSISTTEDLFLVPEPAASMQGAGAVIALLFAAARARRARTRGVPGAAPRRLPAR